MGMFMRVVFVFVVAAACFLPTGCRLGARRSLESTGGIRLVYKAELEPTMPASVRSHAMDRIVQILERRTAILSNATLATVRRQGTDGIVVELPEYADLARARDLMGSTSDLKIYHARNVATEQQDKRPYRVEKHEGPNQTPVVTFYDQIREKEITPTDPTDYAKVIAGWDLILDGTDLEEAKVTQGTSGHQPSFEFSSEGARKLSAWCRKYKDDEENIAEVLDGVVLAIAPLRQGAILSDNAYIDGDFDPAYVRELVDRLNAGALPAKLTLVDATVIRKR